MRVPLTTHAFHRETDKALNALILLGFVLVMFAVFFATVRYWTIWKYHDDLVRSCIYVRDHHFKG